MALADIFSESTTQQFIQRINKLSPSTTPNWGSMNVAQMLAHCNVPYEMVYTDLHAKPNFFMKWILTSFVKKNIVNEVPYKHNLRTAPQFIVTTAKNFDAEKKRLIDHIAQTQQLGRKAFDGKASHSFGKLSAEEWNNMFYKHLDHHLSQFGV